MIRSILAFPVASALILAGCGEDKLKEPPVHDIPGVILLDTAEEGEGQVPLTDPSPPPGFNSYGFWYTYHDVGTCEGDGMVVEDIGGTVSPAQGANFTVTPYGGTVMPPPETLPNAPDNQKALRISGTAHSYFGAGLGFKLESAYAGTAPGVNFMAAGIVGVRFWAYSPTPTSYIVKLHDKYSTSEAGLCEPRGPAPACVGFQHCENAATAPIKVTSTWQLYEVYFTATVDDDPATSEFEIGPMERGNWAGVMTKDGMEIGPSLPADPTSVYQIQFQTSAGDAAFDLWVDNFGFIVGGGPADNSAGAPAPAGT